MSKANRLPSTINAKRRESKRDNRRNIPVQGLIAAHRTAIKRLAEADARLQSFDLSEAPNVLIHECGPQFRIYGYQLDTFQQKVGQRAAEMGLTGLKRAEFNQRMLMYQSILKLLDQEYEAWKERSGYNKAEAAHWEASDQRDNAWNELLISAKTEPASVREIARYVSGLEGDEGGPWKMRKLLSAISGRAVRQVRK